MIDGASGALANKALAMALDGDRAALQLCMNRLLAPRRHRGSGFALPELRNAADLAPAMAAIAEAVAAGELSTGEAVEFTHIVDAFGRALAAGDVEGRLQRLEAVNCLAR